MRILFTFVGGLGHFHPLVPIAWAAQAAGHTVAVAGKQGVLPAIEAAGLTGVSMGASAAPRPEQLALQPVDRARELRDVRERFADKGARGRTATLLNVFGAWRPDVVVCDEMDFGGMIAAERLGLPYASVLVIASGALIAEAEVAAPLSAVRAAYELAPDPDLAMLSRYLVLSPFPPSYRDPLVPLPATAHTLRPLEAAASADAEPPAWLADFDDAPLVYFTLGTVFNVESGDLFGRVLAGLAQLPINVIATVGREIDPAALGPQPARIRIERYVVQAAILPRCAAVVSHGGSGSVIGALMHGLPAVLIPMGADQPYNGDRCAALGVARVLDPVAATPADVRDAVAAVLSDASYRQAAQRLQAESAALPQPEHAVRLLERLAAERQPILAGG